MLQKIKQLKTVWFQKFILFFRKTHKERCPSERDVCSFPPKNTECWNNFHLVLMWQMCLTFVFASFAKFENVSSYIVWKMNSWCCIRFMISIEMINVFTIIMRFFNNHRLFCVYHIDLLEMSFQQLNRWTSPLHILIFHKST